MKIYEITDYDLENTLTSDPKLSQIGVSEFKKVYPDVELSVDDTELSTGPDIGQTGKDFHISYYPMIEGDNAGIFINDAYSGEYKGVVSNIVKNAIKYIVSHKPGSIPTLFVESDESGGAWEQMAKKLGIAYKIVE